MIREIRVAMVCGCLFLATSFSFSAESTHKTSEGIKNSDSIVTVKQAQDKKVSSFNAPYGGYNNKENKTNWSKIKDLFL